MISIPHSGSSPGGPARQRDDTWSKTLERVGQARDEQAFAELFAHFAPLIKGFCLGNLNSSFPADAADEVVQEVMFKVWQKAPTYDASKAAASTWIYTVMRNCRIDLMRRNQRVPIDREVIDIDDIWDEADDDQAFVYLQQSSNEALIDKSFIQLPPEQRQVLTQVYMQGKTHQQIADETGLPLGTVKSRVRIGLKKMQTLILDAEKTAEKNKGAWQ
ncbi:ECF RNA polymerase sigma factor RpoE [Cellvibrio zantedeschiae]|uniref:ECF RNA polymerase sigma factor RpoE n=1 Tax=Cellvibrio zantedeschiae TaxID=1237077 RepID=A0ABQ3B273_9GAMM|nr:sigma-70 family RNA polymerase sigma factor [Cellvibrio zantedeschiae]GGY75409.1 ECF RNA polymerase sigma factor RpoE [Cellvibrio zantedeschiae]